MNADESEPGTCKDIPQIMANPARPHRGDGNLFARDSLRTRFRVSARRSDPPAAPTAGCYPEATEAGLLGDLKITAHSGAGAYICGEETALLDSLEGRRRTPAVETARFPAAQGLYARPTVINNVETISQVAGYF
ncbi:hypothetical protein [Mobiluncus curtisii]|uniref:NADH-quinone oxidoreductase chain 1 n=1 Tax=Mobiluncus curtisii TaxID=2051 RepID=A0A2X3BD88_9ACTO|nr:hypothetical protein [Mobiluncus curtisii]SQC01592.1 NADH-quinone oxidoreductase chain 1 [Mobiluncus curtisii]